LFMHAPNTLKYRPDAKTKLKNFFLAGDFVKTTTDLATMEAANEAARLAVNALLDQDASREKRCGHWPMVPAPAEATSSLARAVAETTTDTGRSVARATGD